MRSHENVPLRRGDAAEESYDGMCLRTRDRRIHRGKPSFGK